MFLGKIFWLLVILLKFVVEVEVVDMLLVPFLFGLS